MGTSLSLERSDRAGWRQAAAALFGLVLLTGCQNSTGGIEQFYDSNLPLDHPVDWWHQMQGGPVAADRPPPPGITDPYPNFSKVPPKPAPVDFAAKRALVSRLTSEREQTARLNQRDPIVFASPNAAAKPAPKPATASAPATAATPAAPAADADTSRLSFDAANATPSAAPTAAAPPVNDPRPPAALTSTQGQAPVVSGPIPAVPEAAPSLPNLPGLPTSNPAPVVLRPIPSTQISFALGSAALPEGADTALKALVGQRFGAPIVVTAGGEARSAAPAAQRAALPLALRRTGAITAALLAAGVPAGDIRAEAVAQGRDASARLLN